VLVVTPPDEQHRVEFADLATAVQEATGDSVELANVDRGYLGQDTEAAAHGWGGHAAEVVALTQWHGGAVLLPRARWSSEGVRQAQA
jgi:hypothetical protein